MLDGHIHATKCAIADRKETFRSFKYLTKITRWIKDQEHLIFFLSGQSC